jgi:hypothetical protein
VAVNQSARRGLQASAAQGSLLPEVAYPLRQQLAVDCRAGHRASLRAANEAAI